MNKVSTENWEQVKQIFEAALARPRAEREAFLDQACSGDAALRLEVGSLITSYEESESFMEAPAVHAAAESLAGDGEKLSPGQHLAHYEILSAVGEGGMGEVYLARDHKLGRKVALKLLPAYFTSDENRLRRFKQEARAASVLSHPNVCVIHEVGETEDGRPFIAMEFVEGVTLRQRLESGSLKLGETLDVAVQVADALTAAHAAGIVHRDIKPENIVLRPDGYVKVLDFGLAKLTEASEGFHSSTATTLMRTSTPGMVMGTVAYMSPEQARGVGVDPRTDVWSLGVVLYEMISGRAPFEGETPTDVVVGIVEKEPPPLVEAVAELPAELERIVRKTLRKNRDERYQLAKELAIDLRSLRRDLQSELDRSLAPERSIQPGRRRSTNELEAARLTATVAASSESKTFRKLLLVVLGLVILSAAGVLGYRWFGHREPTLRDRFRRITVTKLTTNGNAVFAAMSRDGKYVAYVMTEAGQQSLWLRQAAVDSNVRLIPTRPGRYLGIAFSPDGNYILYGYVGATAGERPELYKVPVLAMGSSPMHVDLYTGPQSPSHDGKRVAFFRYDDQKEEDRLITANADGSNEQVVATRKWPARFGWSWDARPAWSSDDQILSSPVVDTGKSPFYLNLYDLRLADRSATLVPLTGQNFELLDGVSMLGDGSGIMATAKAQGASFFQVWQVLRDGSARQITSDLSDYLAMSLPADASSIVTVQRQVLSNIWMAPPDDPVRAAQLTSGVGRYFDVSWTPDGKIVYASDASGNANVYQMEPNGLETRALTDAGRNYAPEVSPDGRYIAFHSNRSGTFQVWRADRNGSNPKQLTNDAYESHWPQFSPDGKWVVFEHFGESRGGSLWKVPTEGGTPEKISDTFGMRPTISPDGKWIAYWFSENQQRSPWRLAVIPFAGNASPKFFDLSPSVGVSWDVMIRWTSDSRNVTYVDHRSGVDNIWSQAIDGGAPKQLTDFKDGQIFSFDWSRDGRLLASRGVQTNDVVLISEAK